jgi:phage shock protein PspC (stress-responsive transcriptional regulator)
MEKKKIYKSNDRKICGVCGGLAEFFGIDPTIVRLVYAILALTYGSGLLIYIIAAIIMDDKPDYVSRG